MVQSSVSAFLMTLGTVAWHPAEAGGGEGLGQHAMEQEHPTPTSDMQHKHRYSNLACVSVCAGHSPDSLSPDWEHILHVPLGQHGGAWGDDLKNTIGLS